MLTVNNFTLSKSSNIHVCAVFTFQTLICSTQLQFWFTNLIGIEEITRMKEGRKKNVSISKKSLFKE